MDSPKIYISRYRAEDGTMRYTVIVQGCPVMADTTDKDAACRVLYNQVQNHKTFGVPSGFTGLPGAWDGTIGEFVYLGEVATDRF